MLPCRDDSARLEAARARINTQLAATIPSGTSTRDFAVQDLAAREGIGALRHNLDAELALIPQFVTTFYTQARGGH